MDRETTEELRGRLLRDEGVRQMIALRAYEIYQFRGKEPGHQAEDWFQAEHEILAFLIEEESRRQDAEVSKPGQEPAIIPEMAERLSAPAAQTADEQAESRSALGVWSPAEPDSAQSAPALGSTGPVDREGGKKKKETRATSSFGAPGKSKATAAKKGATTSKKGATKKAATKKPTEQPAKPKRSRRPPAEEK